ncbi:tripartite tricarboxylate transporter substrate binding protein [Thermodesulforhabdus norvegica]|uniref:Tripartite-type tricarboxylate transporter, receptor component TctC n=1 Tax=Thermodesulforhabdus norvegica TaxID=39841 RepID=A0A1I4R314_9BACT|nr:tripartite tricarboxylate transporter substrate binding protein [Thermodesulforhabdus norvegica]SFM46641.1 Tripartite-type tricarboxylate transporter, receptor component TctC [Thermodesulforhabdus norvegica]
MKRLAVLSVMAAFFMVLGTGKGAMAWPDNPITIYVGWSAGGSSDVTTRAVAAEMEKKLGTRILVTNVTGALGAIGGTRVAKAPADGYLWFGGAAVLGTWPVMGSSDVSWNDFYAFLSVVFPTTIYVKSDAPWKTLDDLINDIKSKPEGTFKFGSPGPGSNGAIFAGLLLDAAGVGGKVQPVPYKGGREAGRYLLSGDVQFVSVTMGDLADWAAAGRIRPLANLYNKDVTFEGITFPAVTKKYPELEPYMAINPYFGVYLNRATPDDIIIKVAEAFAWAVKQPGFQRIAVKERAGVLAPLMGVASDQQMSKIESARCWALHSLGIAKKDPKEFGIPKITEWKWPPHDRAKNLKPWPQKVEEIYAELAKELGM